MVQYQCSSAEESGFILPNVFDLASGTCPYHTFLYLISIHLSLYILLIEEVCQKSKVNEFMTTSMCVCVSVTLRVFFWDFILFKSCYEDTLVVSLSAKVLGPPLQV